MGESSYLYVSVVSQGRMEVQVPDRVEKGKTIEAIVKMYDSNDELLRLDEDLQFYELHEDIFNSNILKVQLGSQKNLDIGEIRYYAQSVVAYD
jgi:nuclear pore complex protein Nup210